jgi:hypothetical protein
MRGWSHYFTSIFAKNDIEAAPRDSGTARQKALLKTRISGPATFRSRIDRIVAQQRVLSQATLPIATTLCRRNPAGHVNTLATLKSNRPPMQTFFFSKTKRLIVL